MTKNHCFEKINSKTLTHTHTHYYEATVYLLQVHPVWQVAHGSYCILTVTHTYANTQEKHRPHLYSLQILGMKTSADHK